MEFSKQPHGKHDASTRESTPLRAIWCAFQLPTHRPPKNLHASPPCLRFTTFHRQPRRPDQSKGKFRECGAGLGGRGSRRQTNTKQRSRVCYRNNPGSIRWAHTSFHQEGKHSILLSPPPMVPPALTTASTPGLLLPFHHHFLCHGKIRMNKTRRPRNVYLSIFLSQYLLICLSISLSIYLL